jgi:hypothetical protein
VSFCWFDSTADSPPKPAKSFPSLFACRRMSMPIESNEAENNEEREGDFYSHAHTWSFLLVQPIVAWKVLANKRHLGERSE